jgi:hypothetical protein
MYTLPHSLDIIYVLGYTLKSILSEWRIEDICQMMFWKQ